MVGETTQVTGQPMVNSSDSRNVNGIQRVAMAALMLVMAVGGLTGCANNSPKEFQAQVVAEHAKAQSKLPPCQGDRRILWNDCFGADTLPHDRANMTDYEYVGEFKNGNWHGQGTVSFPEGAQYIGEFDDGVFSGIGTITFANRDEYAGDWKNGKPNGVGTFTFRRAPYSGDKYSGAFKDGNQNGQGTYTWADGRRFVGTFRNNKRHGPGKEFRINGSIVLQGYWVDGAYYGWAPPGSYLG